MRIYLSGNEELASFHLPVVQAKAIEFEDRCKKSGLRQNAMHFEFSDTGTTASVLHVFGETSVSIYSPFSTTTETQEQRDSEEQKIAIWIRTFDHAIRFSYNGMFFSYDEYIAPTYDPPYLTITSIENKTPDDNAFIVSRPQEKDSIYFKNFSEPFGVNSVFSVCGYKTADGLAVRGPSMVSGQYSYGYKECAFYSPDGHTLICDSGGDFSYPDTIYPTYESIQFDSTMSVFMKNGPGKVAWPLGPSYEEISSRLCSAIYDMTGGYGYLFAEWFFGFIKSSSRVESKRFHNISRYTCLYYSGAGNTSFTQTYSARLEESSEGVTNFSIVEVGCCSDTSVIIKMIDIDGTIIETSLDPKHLYAGPKEEYQNFQFTSTTGCIVVLSYTGLVVPARFSGAPRGYIGCYFSTDIFSPEVSAIAYSEETGWQRCESLGILNDLNFTSGIGFWYLQALMWARFAEWCLVSIVVNATSTTKIILKKRVPHPHLANWFKYQDEITLPLNSSSQRAIIFCSENAKYISLYGFIGYSNGIYSVSTGSMALLYEYDQTEVEPILIDDIAGVVCGKKSIYLSFGARAIPCNECCGIFLDYTHYVDRLTDGSFVIYKIGNSNDEIVEVDRLESGMYNFYEFSEDASVCVISNYSTDGIAAPQNPAIVLDFSDPVYRFEPSDQIISHHFNATIYNENNGSGTVGYPSVIPFGARYVTLCSCYPAGADVRTHYIYHPYSSGHSTLCLGSACPLQPGSFVKTSDTFPTIVPQYSDAVKNRRNVSYNEKRLNRYIYHHTGKILRRISDKLVPIDIDF